MDLLLQTIWDRIGPDILVWMELIRVLIVRKLDSIVFFWGMEGILKTRMMFYFGDFWESKPDRLNEGEILSERRLTGERRKRSLRIEERRREEEERKGKELESQRRLDSDFI